MVPMYVEIVPNRDSRPAVLLREGWREGTKVKKRTLANLTDWPEARIEALRRVLRNEPVRGEQGAFLIERSLPHGHVAAVLGTARRCGVEKLLAGAPVPLRRLVLALIVARIIEPGSKLATWRMLRPESAAHSLSHVLGLGEIELDAVYEALDWLGEAQPRIERALARKHLTHGVLVLYDLSSTWVTGQCCPLAAFGHSRDDKGKYPQIVFGLLCSAEGIPVAVEVFAGNTGDPSTLAAQLDKLKARFGLSHVVWVGDRGMITQARIDELLRPAGMGWITALRSPDIAKLIEEQGPWQLSLFDERGLIEVASEHYPGERLVVCRNPALAQERADKREALLKATEKDLDAIVGATGRARRPLQGKDAIGLRVGRVINAHKMAKHFDLTITETRFAYARRSEQIQAEAALDGFYVIRTNVPSAQLSDARAVSSYKSLAQVERAFRSLKTVDLHVRPIFHWNEARVRAHVFLCMLAYYVEWHMRQALKPMLYDDEELEAQRENRANPVAPTPRSARAKAKALHHRTEDGLPVHSLRTLLLDLATVTLNVTSTTLNPQAKINVTTRPTPLQAKAFALLGVDPACSQ
jgi:Transposase DDE domain